LKIRTSKSIIKIIAPAAQPQVLGTTAEAGVKDWKGNIRSQKHGESHVPNEKEMLFV